MCSGLVAIEELLLPKAQRGFDEMCHIYWVILELTVVVSRLFRIHSESVDPNVMNEISSVKLTWSAMFVPLHIEMKIGDSRK